MGMFDKSFHDLVNRYSSITEQQYMSRAEAEASIKRRQEDLANRRKSAEDAAKNQQEAPFTPAFPGDTGKRIGPEVLPGFHPFDAILGGETNTYNINAKRALAARKAMEGEKAQTSAPPPAVKTPTSKSKPAIKAKRSGDKVRPVSVNNPAAGGVPSQPGVPNSRFGGLLGTVSNVIGRAGDTAQNIASGQMNRGVQRRSTSLIPSIKPPPALRRRSTNVPAPRAK